MVVLGIDPGTARTGYGVVSLNDRGTLESRAYGVVSTSPTHSPEARLAEIYEALSALIREHAPDVVAIEELFFKNNITTGISVAQARGVAMLAAAHAEIPVVGYKPAEVKQAVVGVGRATKDQMRYMTQVLLGLREKPKPDDAADGLAVAICHLHRAPAAARLAKAATLS